MVPWDLQLRLDTLELRLAALEGEQKGMSTTVSQLKNDVAALVTATTTALAQISQAIKDLSAQASSGVAISQSDLDAIDQEVTTLSTSIQSAGAAAVAADPTPPTSSTPAA